VKYTKSALSFDEQVDLLLSRGMLGDRAEMKERLACVSYYRLSGYWFHRKLPNNSFKPGTTFATVWDQYVFDRSLRLLMMDAVERIEISVRTQISYHHAQRFSDPFAYANAAGGLPELRPEERTTFLERTNDEMSRSHEQFVGHFKQKYGDFHDCLPIWMATEVMSFGGVLKLYKGSPRDVRNNVASYFGMPDEVIWSWLLSLNTLRNICAHHGRLWNRAMGTKPKMPKQRRYPEWHFPVMVTAERLFALLTISNYCLHRIAPGSHWSQRLVKLLTDHPRIPHRNMGFPENWLDCPIWHDAKGGHA